MVFGDPVFVEVDVGCRRKGVKGVLLKSGFHESFDFLRKQGHEDLLEHVL